MATPQGTIRVYQHDQTVTYRVEGKATMPQSAPLRRHAERCLGAGATHIRMDLRHCTYMDSTFIGTLLRLHNLMTRNGQGTLLIVSPSASCGKLFAQMGLGDLFSTELEEADLGAGWAELPLEGDDPTLFRRTVVQAHEELAGLPGKAGEQFQQVARCLAQAAEDEKKKRPQ